jgi:DNA replication protein DnaC
VDDLINQLKIETRKGQPGRLADHLTRMDFIVLHELGYLPFAQSGSQLRFHPISQLYEHTSIIVTTNRSGVKKIKPRPSIAQARIVPGESRHGRYRDCL